MRSKSQAESYLTLVPSSMRMPRWTHRGWPEHYPVVHLWSEVRYHPTQRDTKLCSSGTPYIPYAPLHNQMLVHSDPTIMGLNRHRRGYHRGALNLWSRPLSTFPSSILHFPLIAQVGLILNHSINYSISQLIPISNQGIKIPKSREWNMPVDFYWSSLY
jgi:hypothetical protein